MRLRIEQPALRVQVRRRRFEPDGSSTKAQRRSGRSQGLRRLGLRGDSDATQQRRAGESTIAAGGKVPPINLKAVRGYWIRFALSGALLASVMYVGGGGFGFGCWCWLACHLVKRASGEAFEQSEFHNGFHNANFRCKASTPFILVSPSLNALLSYSPHPHTLSHRVFNSKPNYCRQHCSSSSRHPSHHHRSLLFSSW